MTVYTVQEVSKQLKVSDDTIIKLITNKQLTASKVGRQWRINETDLLTFFKKKSTNPKS
jgi:excisionase family DNA binding protein